MCLTFVPTRGHASVLSGHQGGAAHPISASLCTSQLLQKVNITGGQNQVSCPYWKARHSLQCENPVLTCVLCKNAHAPQRMLDAWQASPSVSSPFCPSSDASERVSTVSSPWQSSRAACAWSIHFQPLPSGVWLLVLNCDCLKCPLCHVPAVPPLGPSTGDTVTQVSVFLLYQDKGVIRATPLVNWGLSKPWNAKLLSVPLLINASRVAYILHTHMCTCVQLRCTLKTIQILFICSYVQLLLFVFTKEGLKGYTHSGWFLLRRG